MIGLLRKLGLTPRVFDETRSMHDKLRIKIEQLARLALAHANNADMMRYSGLSQSGLSRILAMPEFRERVAALQQGLMAHADNKLVAKLDKTMRTFDDAVPEALAALVETVKQGRDLRSRMIAAREILDRDPAGRATLASDRQTALGAGAPGLPQGVLDNTLADAAPLAGMTRKPLEQSDDPNEVSLASRLATVQELAGSKPV